MDLTGKPFEASDQKSKRKTILDHAQKKLKVSFLKATNKHFPCKRTN